jgi:hypothetical protein
VSYRVRVTRTAARQLAEGLFESVAAACVCVLVRIVGGKPAPCWGAAAQAVRGALAGAPRRVSRPLHDRRRARGGRRIGCQSSAGRLPLISLLRRVLRSGPCQGVRVSDKHLQPQSAHDVDLPQLHRPRPLEPHVGGLRPLPRPRLAKPCRSKIRLIVRSDGTTMPSTGARSSCIRIASTPTADASVAAPLPAPQPAGEA